MEDAAFSDEFCRFLRASVPTVEAAETLLLLQREPERWWSVEEVVKALLPGASLSPAAVAGYFVLFHSNGMIAIGPDKRAQYRPGTSELERHAATLAQAYLERPVTLIRVIYALRDAKIRSFAEAFRLKRH